jgi:hypothetical protein
VAAARRQPERERFWFGRLRSGRPLAALRDLERHRRLRSAGILAGALAAVGASSAGLDSALPFTISANRFDPAWRGYPGPLRPARAAPPGPDRPLGQVHPGFGGAAT